MQTDSYSLAVRVDMLGHLLARAHSECDHSECEDEPADHLARCAREQVRRCLCPCLLDDVFICDALIDDFRRRLAAGTATRQDAVIAVPGASPAPAASSEQTWENEGGRCPACFGRTGQ